MDNQYTLKFRTDDLDKAVRAAIDLAEVFPDTRITEVIWKDSGLHIMVESGLSRMDVTFRFEDRAKEIAGRDGFEIEMDEIYAKKD